LRDQIFISYSHKDRKWVDRLLIVLRPSITSKNLSVWDDSKISTGEVWRDEIKKAISRARVAVLMVSPDFLASDFIAEHELLPLLDAARKEGLSVLWVAVRDSLYRQSALAGYQAANDPSKPLASLKGGVRDRELVQICDKITSAAVMIGITGSLSGQRGSVPQSDCATQKMPTSDDWENPERHRKPTIEDLGTLRQITKMNLLHEHVADSTTVRISHYPTALRVSYVGKSDKEEIALFAGQEATLSFKKGVNAFGFYYQQGMQNGLISIKLQDGTSNTFLGQGFFPNTNFFGFYSSIPIDTLRIRTHPRGGGFYVKGFYFYSLRNHPRVFADLSEEG
jgi:hypothetical protein